MFISLFLTSGSLLFFFFLPLRVTVYYYHVTYTFQGESTLYSFGISCLKQAQYLSFRHSSNKLSLLCCRLLDAFNENVLRQRGLEKYFYERVSLVSTFFLLVSNYLKRNFITDLQVNFFIINQSCLVPVLIIFNTILLYELFATTVHYKILSNLFISYNSCKFYRH